jgi:hypothetical protein
VKYSVIIEFIQQCSAASTPLIQWLDEEHLFDAENAEGAAPGGFLNQFGYYVIGSTVGGHAIVLSDEDPRVTFADYTWYDDDEVDYQDLSGDGEWHTLPLSLTNVRKSLYELASDRDVFLVKLRAGAIERLLDPIA